MSGPKRNPDKLNTLGVIVIGICASVLVYVTIVALQAFYMKDTSEIQTMADYGGNDTNFRTVKTAAMNNINEYGKNPDGSFRIGIDVAMKKVVEGAKADPSNLVPGTPSTSPSAEPIFGRSKPLANAPAAGSGSDAGSAAGSAAGAGSAAAGSAAGSAAAPATGSAAPMAPTGGQAQGGGPAPTAGANNPGTNNMGSAAAPKANAGSGSAAKGNAP
ncbi:MAG: hypothetical protein AB7T06_12675 [Kofleriaceae bacterium]